MLNDQKSAPKFLVLGPSAQKNVSVIDLQTTDTFLRFVQDKTRTILTRKFTLITIFTFYQTLDSKL